MTLFRITAKGQMLSQEWRNVWYGFDTIAAVDELQDEIDDIHAAYATFLTAQFSTSCNVYGYDVKNVQLADTPTFAYTPTAGTATGGDGNIPTANQTALLISFKALTVRPNAVRKYMAGQTIQFLAATGKWTAPGLANAATFADAIIAVGTGAPNFSFPMSVKFDEEGIADTWNEMTSSIVRDIPATQRRRRLGVGI